MPSHYLSNENLNNNHDENHDQENSQSNRPNFFASLEKEQKIGLIALAVFSVLVFTFWAIQFKRSILAPAENNELAQNIPEQNLQQSDSALQEKDTDGDGLSDWEELNNYKTSPYLEDSDSDGFSDKSEIDSGNNPNCPTGRDCGDIFSIPDEDSSVLPFLDEISNSDPATNAGVKDLLGGAVDADTLRQMLTASGMTKEILDQISDEDLVKSYQETLQSQQ